MIPHSDTAPGVKPLPGTLGRLTRTRFANLRRDRLSGTFFAVAKVAGRLVRKSLKTKSQAVAKVRLDALLGSLRAQWSGGEHLEVAEWTMGRLLRVFEAQVRQKPKLKPRTIDYRLFTLAKLRESWPALESLKVRALTREAVRTWAAEYRARGYSAGLYNSTVDTLRQAAQGAVEMGLLAQNPVSVEKQTVRREFKRLPSDAEFRALLAHLEQSPKCGPAALRVAVLAHSGQRPENVRQLRRRDVDLAQRLVHWPPIKHNAEVNTQPMSDGLFQVMQVLVARHPGDDSPLVPVACSKTALRGACRRLGITPAVSEGLFRHWWTTRALEAGIPVASVAAMRGDKDGGAMLLKTYFHARIEVLREQVKKL